MPLSGVYSGSLKSETSRYLISNGKYSEVGVKDSRPVTTWIGISDLPPSWTNTDFL
jgi:hypothetical protein